MWNFQNWMNVQRGGMWSALNPPLLPRSRFFPRFALHRRSWSRALKELFLFPSLHIRPFTDSSSARHLIFDFMRYKLFNRHIQWENENQIKSNVYYKHSIVTTSRWLLRALSPTRESKRWMDRKIKGNQIMTKIHQKLQRIGAQWRKKRMRNMCGREAGAKGGREREKGVYTYRISSSANPLKACSSKHVISLLSICRLRSDVAPLKIFRPIVVSKLCDRSLRERTVRMDEKRRVGEKRKIFSLNITNIPIRIHRHIYEKGKMCFSIKRFFFFSDIISKDLILFTRLHLLYRFNQYARKGRKQEWLQSDFIPAKYYLVFHLLPARET